MLHHLDSKEVAELFTNRHLQCIIDVGQGLAQGRGAPEDNGAIVRQLTTAMAAQNKAATESNHLFCNKIQCQDNKEENKKIHSSIPKMICRAAARTSNDKKEDLPDTFTQFLNCKNVAMAQYDLVHQF